MNTSNLIKQAGFNPSKEQEVAILRQFGIEIASVGYLHSLVSVDLVKWFEGQTRLDVSCDLMAELENARNERWATDANQRTALADAEKLAEANAEAAKQFKVAQESAETDAVQAWLEVQATRADLEILQAERDELRRRLERVERLAAKGWMGNGFVGAEALRMALTGPLAEQD